jgi:histidinol-phosphate aminotransferase
MTVKPRSALQAMRTYTPGRSAEAAMQEYSLSSAIKLASNEVSLAPLASVQAVIAQAAAEVNRYPEHTAPELKHRLAEVLGVDPTWVGVGCGSVAIIQQLFLAFVDPGDEVAFPWRSFEAYPIDAAQADAVARLVPLRRESFDMSALADVVNGRTRLVLLASPNNPTGSAVRRGELDAFLERVPPTTLVVIDEAYHEFVTGADVPDGLDYVRRFDNVAVLRTFSKAYGLAGLRVGYVVARPEVIDALEKVRAPFSVNLVAQRAALASLDAWDELADRCRSIVAERGRVAQALRRRGFSVPESQGNFIFLPSGDVTVDLVAATERHGVVTRGFAGDGIRVTVGQPDENEQFLDAFDAARLDLDLDGSWRLPVGDRASATAEWVDRLHLVMARLDEHARGEHAGLTAPDPPSGERWDAAQVWAHLGEIGEYWLGELEPVLAGGGEPVPFGRVKSNPARIAAIERGRSVASDRHFVQVQRCADRLEAIICGLSQTEWQAIGRHSTLGDMSVDRILEEFLVGHYEQHADQLDTLCS